jgi:hypothetical protein
MTSLVNGASGQVVGVVDGCESAAVQAWLGHRSQAWLERIQILAIDPSAAHKKAMTTALPATECCGTRLVSAQGNRKYWERGKWSGSSRPLALLARASICPLREPPRSDPGEVIELRVGVERTMSGRAGRRCSHAPASGAAGPDSRLLGWSRLSAGVVTVCGNDLSVGACS